MYWDIADNVKELIEPIARDHGLEVVDASIRQGRGRGLFRVVLDTPRGDGRVTVDQCADVSREIGRALDVNDLIQAAYTLEVCSPGVDRTLGRPVDFERSVGRTVALETRQPLEGRRRFKGELVEFVGDELHLQVGAQRVQIPLTAVARAKAIYVEEGRAKR